MPSEAHFSHTQAMLKDQLNSKQTALDEPLPPAATLTSHSTAEDGDAPEATKKSSVVDGVVAKETTTLETGSGGRTEAVAGEDAKAEVFKVPSQPASVKQGIEPKGTPTPWDKLDIKTMKVPELKVELEARGIEAKGVKAQLVTRLTEVLKEEQENSENQVQIVDAVMEESEPSASKESTEEQSKSETAKKEETVVESESSIEKEAEKRIAEEKEARKRRERELKERKETKKDLERHYSLSSLTSPAILVYPNKTYKNGKYECKLTSLHSLLDYKSDDNSEYAFEMAVFAEAFYEMMMRDGAYNVYKILLHLRKQEAEKSKEKKDEQAGKEEQKTETVNEKVEESEQKAEKVDENKMDTGEATTENPTPQNDLTSPDKDKESDSKPKSTTQVDEKDQKKSLPVDPRLAFSLAVFDTTRCGYLHTKDVEEILYFLSLRLTKGQIQKLIKCMPNREELNYRKLGFTLKDVDVDVLDLQGNKKLAKSIKLSSASTASSGVVSYQGKFVDIAKSLKQMQRLDEEKLSLEQRCAIVDKDIKKVKEHRDTLDKKRKRLEDDVRDYKKRLSDAEKCLKNSQDDTVQLKASLLRCKDLCEQIGQTADKMLPSKRESSATTTLKGSASNVASPKQSNDIKDEKRTEVAVESDPTTLEVVKKEAGEVVRDCNQMQQCTNENGADSKSLIKNDVTSMECDNV